MFSVCNDKADGCKKKTFTQEQHNKIRKMKKTYLIIIAALSMMLAACGGDDDNTATQMAAANINANKIEKGAYVARIEVPAVKSGSNYQILVKNDAEIGINYMVEWDCDTKAQRWTCWHWTKDNSFKGWERKKWDNGEKFNNYGGNGDPFQPDPALDGAVRSELSDYKNSGYSRGHMCASEDRICSKNVNGQTYYLSNMHPQVQGHNAGVWNSMENRVRLWRDNAIAEGGELFVCRGGTIYKKGSKESAGTSQDIIGTIGKNIPVPKYFFMAVLKKSASGAYSAIAFWSEHKAESVKDINQYIITIDELEKRTGYDFFCNLPDVIENTIEKTVDMPEWQ